MGWREHWVKWVVLSLGLLISFEQSVFAMHPAACMSSDFSSVCTVEEDILRHKLYTISDHFYHLGTGESNLYLASQVLSTPHSITLLANKMEEWEKNEKYMGECAAQSGIDGSRGGYSGGNRTPPGVCEFKSGEISTEGFWSTKGIAHGYIEVEATMPVGKESVGMWPAIWMLPKDSCHIPWPMGGEIDIAELKGNQSRQAQATLHFNEEPYTSRYQYLPNNPGVYTLSDPESDYASPHKYGLEWDFRPEHHTLSWWYDNKKWLTQDLDNSFRIADKDQYVRLAMVFKKGSECGYYLIINLATGGDFGFTDENTASEQEMKIYSIKVYNMMDK